MKLTTIFGGTAVALASAALLSATPASAASTYYFFDFEAPPITSQVTVTPITCSVPAYCGTVTYTPTAAFDEITLLDGADFYFAPTAFTVHGAYTAQPGSADTVAQFSTNILNGTADYEFTDAAPEPASWALMIVGVGLAGGMLRYGRRQGATSVA